MTLAISKLSLDRKENYESPLNSIRISDASFSLRQNFIFDILRLNLNNDFRQTLRQRVRDSKQRSDNSEALCINKRAAMMHGRRCAGDGARIMNSVDLRESGSYRETRQGGARSLPPSSPPRSLLLSKYLRYRTRARANSMAKVQETETRNSLARARDISGYGRARIHGRNGFSSRWKLVEKRGGLSHRKPRAGASRSELFLAQ